MIEDIATLRTLIEEELHAFVAQSGQHDFRLTFSAPTMHYYSVIWIVKVDNLKTTESQQLVCKFVKSDRSRKALLPITEADHRMGKAEYESLMRVHSYAIGDKDNLKVQFIQAKCYLEKSNCIVTPFIAGHDLLDTIRATDLWSRFGAGDSTYLTQALRNVGRYIKKIHQADLVQLPYPLTTITTKIRLYREMLSTSISDPLGSILDRLSTALDQRTDFSQCPQTLILKGFDVRNIIRSDRGDLVILDPGKSKRAPIEADLSAFVATLRFVHWSNPQALLLKPRDIWERSFLDAYGEKDTLLYHAFLIKDLLKLWHIAYHSLTLLDMPASIKNIVARWYIDPIYSRHVRQECALLQRLL